MRSFFAFEIPDIVKNEIESLLKSIKLLFLPLRWVDINNIHLTVLFLGDVEQNIVDSVKPKVETICLKTKSFSLSVEGGGFFGAKKFPKVLWAGIAGLPEDAAIFKSAVEKQFEPFGIKSEERPFKPHLTLGRFKDRPDEKALIKCLSELENFKSSVFDVNQLTLFKSDLSSKGAVYTKIFTFKLAD